MYTHTVRKEVAGEMVETRTNVSRQIYDQLLAQVSLQKTSETLVFVEERSSKNGITAENSLISGYRAALHSG